jgi:hypothetical protein
VRVVAAPTIKRLRFSISAWPMKHNRASLLGLRAPTSLSKARSRSGNSPKDRSPSVPLPEIDERVHAFLDRPLAGEWPYLWLDATYLKQREGGRIVAVAAIIAVAANSDGRREIVGLHIGPSEAETQERLAQCSCHHAPASADSDRADGGSRRRRAEYLSLLRRAYGHRRDFRTRLPAATVAQSSNRLRQFMTSTLLPPSHIAAPVPGRYLIADGHPPPTATVGAAFDRQRQSAHYKTTVPILHTATKPNAAVITQPSLGQDVQGREGYWVAPCQRDPRIGPVPQQRSQ